MGRPSKTPALNMEPKSVESAPANDNSLPADLRLLPAVLTSREAARVLRIGIREVRALVDSGQLAGFRYGPRRVIRVSRAALLNLLKIPGRM